MFEHEKTLFEIYREAGYDRRYRVVYYTDLNEHNKESEINRALAGKTFYHGFIKNYGKDEAKEAIAKFLARLNSGEALEPAQLEEAIAEFQPQA